MELFFVLNIQEPFFSLDASGEACQGVVCANDSVAGNEDADAVGSNGLRHSPYALEIVHAEGYLLVGSGFAVGNFEQGLPHLLLEISAYWV